MKGAVMPCEHDRSDEHEQPVAVIIGMPGAGKTRVGHETALRLGLDFIDVDRYIEHDVNMTIAQYFERYGEPAFRSLEASTIADLLGRFTGMLALGGGAAMTDSTQRLLTRYVRRHGRLIYLQADPQEAMVRARHGGKRPLLSGDADSRWWQLYAERDPVYARLANIRVRTHGSTPHTASRKLEAAMRQRMIHIDTAGSQPYDVRIAEHVLDQLALVVGDHAHSVALIHTQSVQRHSDRARAQLRQAGYRVVDLVIADAEAGKTIPVADTIWQRLAEEGFTRSDAIVGLGGGAATDLAGFVAATWMRGIRYVNCPTSLLAMVDASTGGKTGVNTPQGKNLVGSFYTPAGVLADLTTLETLPNDIFIEGLGEVAKSGFIRDSTILDVLERHCDELRSFDSKTFLGSGLESTVEELIERTVRVKAYHVSRDLKESGLREFLNYGHTLAHAIETIERFTWRHGNAVAVGCVYAAELAHLLGYLTNDELDYHRSLLSALGLPVSWSGGTWEEVLALMHRDKKARGNTLRFVVLDGLQHPIHLDDPPLDAVHEAFLRIRRR